MATIANGFTSDLDKTVYLNFVVSNLIFPIPGINRRLFPSISVFVELNIIQTSLKTSYLQFYLQVETCINPATIPFSYFIYLFISLISLEVIVFNHGDGDFTIFVFVVPEFTTFIITFPLSSAV